MCLRIREFFSGKEIKSPPTIIKDTFFRPQFVFMIWTHLGPWKTGLTIFEFGFDFAELFDRNVRKIWLRSVILDLVKPLLINLNHFPHEGCVYPKSGSPDCSFASNQRQHSFNYSYSALSFIYRGVSYIIEYLGEIETNVENILPFFSRACRLGRILKIIEVENLVTHSL